MPACARHAVSPYEFHRSTLIVYCIIQHELSCRERLYHPTRHRSVVEWTDSRVKTTRPIYNKRGDAKHNRSIPCDEHETPSVMTHSVSHSFTPSLKIELCRKWNDFSSMSHFPRFVFLQRVLKQYSKDFQTRESGKRIRHGNWYLFSGRSACIASLTEKVYVWIGLYQGAV